ncbi:MAG TPA: oligosaccharide flippase family protein [Ignavibacteria bacterium]|nr:oligosaccharide flippase family protein [Ignavibacteria bacterium]
MIRANLKNLSYQTIAQIIPRAMMFIFTFYLARILGSEEYGKYDFALSFGYLIGVFYELGGNIIITKHVARGLFSSFYYSLKFRIITIFSTIAITFIILYSFNLYSGNLTNILYAMAGIAFSSLMNLYFAFFRGVKRMNFEAVVLIIQKIIFIVITFILISSSLTSSSVLISFLISMMISYLIIFMIFGFEKNKYDFKSNDKKIALKDYMKDIMSLALIEVFSIIYFRVTQIILESFMGYNAVGVYGASYKFIEVFTNIPAILMIVLFPNFAKLAVENISEFKKGFNKVLKILILLGIGAVSICWIFGEMFFELLGEDYSGAYIVLRYMTPALLIIYPNYLLTQSMIALDKNIKYAFVLFSVLILNILIGILIVPQFGVYGSALSVGVCEIIIFISTFYLINKELKTRIAG